MGKELKQLEVTFPAFYAPDTDIDLNNVTIVISKESWIVAAEDDSAYYVRSSNKYRLQGYKQAERAES